MIIRNALNRAFWREPASIQIRRHRLQHASVFIVSMILSQSMIVRTGAQQPSPNAPVHGCLSKSGRWLQNVCDFSLSVSFHDSDMCSDWCFVELIPRQTTILASETGIASVACKSPSVPVVQPPPSCTDRPTVQLKSFLKGATDRASSARAVAEYAVRHDDTKVIQPQAQPPAAPMAPSLAGGAGRTIIQSYTPQPEDIRTNEVAQSIAGNSRYRATCKVLSVTNEGLGWANLLIYGNDQQAMTYPNGVCHEGTVTAPLNVPVASSNPNYKWVGAWIRPAGMTSGSATFWPNGQFAMGMTARSWVDVQGGPVGSHVLVEVNDKGVVWQAWDQNLQGGHLYPSRGDDSLPPP